MAEHEQHAQELNGPGERRNIIGLPVRLGRDDERIIELVGGGRVGEFLEIISRELGCAIEEIALFREGDGEPLALEVIIDIAYPHQHRHHVHSRTSVLVTVFYQAASHQGEFGRHTTVEHVLDWAIKTFKVDLAMAAEFELARHGQKEELPSTEHIGHLAGPHHRLELDLTRGDITNGALP